MTWHHREIWRSAESIPGLGKNLTAVREVVAITDTVAREVVGPAAQLDPSMFRPSGGHLNVQNVRALAATASTMSADLISAQHAIVRVQMSADLISAQHAIVRVHTQGLMPQVASGVDKLSGELTKAVTLSTTLKNVTALLPGALGMDGPKNYLLLFQNNAETRGWGGNPAAVMLLHLDNGTVTIAGQSNSNNFSSPDFHNGEAAPIMPLDPSMEALYGDKIGRYEQDTTTPADFPYTAQLISKFWTVRYGGSIDGVMSFDPVALGYLLDATGPVATPSGDTLTAQNASSFLLNEVYFKYTDPAVQNVVFADAAAAVFDTIKEGHFDTKKFIGALVKAADQHRLLIHDNDPAVQKVIATTPMPGRLPATNTPATGIGVFFDDTTGAKMDYYLHPTITLATTQCDASGQSVQGSVVMRNSAPLDSATALPSYITGPFYVNGRIAMDVVIYGLPGGKLTGLTVNGAAVTPTYLGENLGRPAAKVSVLLPPQNSLTIGFTTTGPAGKHGPLQLFTTGLAQPTSTVIQSTGACR